MKNCKLLAVMLGISVILVSCAKGNDSKESAIVNNVHSVKVDKKSGPCPQFFFTFTTSSGDEVQMGVYCNCDGSGEIEGGFTFNGSVSCTVHMQYIGPSTTWGLVNPVFWQWGCNGDCFDDCGVDLETLIEALTEEFQQHNSPSLPCLQEFM